MRVADVNVDEHVIQNNPLLTAALDYAKRGWGVFPLRGKLPWIGEKQGGHGHLDATTDPEQIRRWWRDFPSANIGIRCDNASFAALDIDPRHGGDKTIHALQEQHGRLPTTVTSISGRGTGWHLLFLPVPGIVGNSASALGAGLDTRGDGKGYIVAPPSIHPDSGQPYRWMPERGPGDVAMEAMPLWMIAALREARTVEREHIAHDLSGDPALTAEDREHYNEWLGGMLDYVSEAEPGEKHDRLWRVTRAIGGHAERCGWSCADVTVSLETALGKCSSKVSSWPAARKTIAYNFARGWNTTLPPLVGDEFWDQAFPDEWDDDAFAALDIVQPNGHDPAPPEEPIEQTPPSEPIQVGDLLVERMEPVDDPRLIPPRQWAYGKFMLFGEAAMLAAMDGGGKGFMTVGIILSIVTGEALLGDRVWRRGRVVIVSYEDKIKEWRLRILVACLHYKLDFNAVSADIFFVRHPDRKLTFGNSRRTKSGTAFDVPDRANLLRVLNRAQAVALIIDPFNHAHGLEDGNNNVMVAKVAGEMAWICDKAQVAGLILHHVRKGSEGKADDFMGATSLRATFRAMRVLQCMPPDTAQNLKLTEHWRYIYISSGKSNYAPAVDQARWFKLESVELGNGDATYPDGDDVAVMVPWSPPNMFEGMTREQLILVFAGLEAQPPCSQNKRAQDRWAGKILMEVGRTETDAKRILAAWLREGVLTEEKWTDPKNRNERDCVMLDRPKADAILRGMDPTAGLEEPGF